eukprot:CAMPEP_0205909218 /NCGR_PEP_ID=MMETSP1325-20131115/3733_1 /ASSEMBLY_ACC=CAM_ASM_000708 /TAXON_ID=236786 /ORGANISM="Florenciella sp., Strain RCC1007" /LENGTH=78 /DNA_ID=CAMNT_0053275497 /DNA_START=99 /DNA_END=332 /DNA_ORIENTATION=+
MSVGSQPRLPVKSRKPSTREGFGIDDSTRLDENAAPPRTAAPRKAPALPAMYCPPASTKESTKSSYATASEPGAGAGA